MQLHRISKERSRLRILTVEAGQVVCPRQGHRGHGTMLGLSRYDGLSAGRIEGLVCKADLAELTPYPLHPIR